MSHVRQLFSLSLILFIILSLFAWIFITPKILLAEGDLPHSAPLEQEFRKTHPDYIRDIYVNAPVVPGSSSAPNPFETETILSTSVLQSGQTLANLLESEGFSDNESYRLTMVLDQVLDLRRLQAGQQVHIQRDRAGRPWSVSLPIGIGQAMEAYRDNEDRWQTRRESIEVVRVPVLAEAVVESSLYEAATDVGITPTMLMNTVAMLSFDVDFQRDFRGGEKLVILYDEPRNPSGEVLGPGTIQYFRLELAHRDVEGWRFEGLDGSVDYYDANGNSIRKSLLKTPVDGARISSSFGYRNHPILGYSAFHRGVDFAAGHGEPVMASGDGVVTIAGWHDQYGWRVKIRHGNGYETQYAHFSRIAEGIRPGVRVDQRQVVGYVGSTGMSTGPHCHYEVILNGVLVNPTELDFPARHSLGGTEARLFSYQQGAFQASYGLH